MELNEAEIQVVATIYSAETEKTPVDKASAYGTKESFVAYHDSCYSGKKGK